MKNLQLQNSEISLIMVLLVDLETKHTLGKREQAKVNAIKQELERAYNER